MLQLGLGCLTNPPKGGVVSLCARERERILDFYTATSKQKVLRRGAKRP